jgi:hypothetical protein
MTRSASSAQREAVNAAIQLANDSGKEGKGGVVLLQKIESRIPKDLDVWRESLSSGEIGFAWDVMEAETARGDPDLATRD